MNRFSVDRASYISTAPSQDASVGIVILLIVVFLTGTVGNARVCVLLRRRHDLRKVPPFLMASLINWISVFTNKTACAFGSDNCELFFRPKDIVGCDLQTGIFFGDGFYCTECYINSVADGH